MEKALIIVAILLTILIVTVGIPALVLYLKGKKRKE